MQTQAPFVLTRAIPQDLSEILNVYYGCFNQHERTIFQGCPTPEYIHATQEIYALDMQSDASDIWIQVRDAEDNRLVAASNWKVYVNGKPGDEGQRIPDWLGHEAYEQSRLALETITAARRKAMPIPFIRKAPIAFNISFSQSHPDRLDLRLCFTSPMYRRQGAGGMMLQWGETRQCLQHTAYICC